MNLTKSFIFVAAIAAIFFSSGCTDRNDPKVVAINKGVLSGDGEYIGTLKDGRRVVRYEIETGSENAHNHFIYVVSSGEATLNRQVSSGKTTRTETTAFIPDNN